MIEDLRTRIAEVLTRDAFGMTTPQTVLRQADAVISELGLEQESFEDGYLTRYVTPWKTNE